jgi:hypothetical protein
MKIDANIQLPDDFYAALIEAHEGLSDQESFELNARMVFLLANQIGDANVLLECVAAAKAA